MPGQPLQSGGNVLAEEYDTADVEEDEDCGCLIVPTTIDGREVQAHHWLPDDFAPHVPDSECGCHPILHDQQPDRLLYEHIDQDQPGERNFGGCDGC